MQFVKEVKNFSSENDGSLTKLFPDLGAPGIVNHRENWGFYQKIDCEKALVELVE